MELTVGLLTLLPIDSNTIMPSRNNRLRNRRAITGEDDDVSSSEDYVVVEKSGVESTKKKKTRQKTKPKKVHGSSSNRLSRLLALLVFTTALLTAYHLYRLATKGTGLLDIKSGASLVNKVSSSSKPIFEKDNSVPGGIVVRSSDSQDDKKGNGELRLEDLDMETLQAAFDALYGDGGPLDRVKQRKEGEGEYRVKGGRKESLHG